MKVILITTNSKKYKEFVKHFDLYGITVIQETTGSIADYSHLLKSKDTIAVMSEESSLVKYFPKCDDVSQFKNLDIVFNKSILNIVFLKDNGVAKTDVFENTISGYIDLSKRTNSPDVFGWDDIFVNQYTNKSNYEMSNLSLKLSARDVNIAEFLKTLSYSPYASDETVRFMTADMFLIDKKYLQTVYEINKPIGIHNILKKFLSKEIFTRHAMNRREKNYWLPSLNSGLPYTVKSDEFHQQTYLFHDICHLMIPDLIVDTNREYGKQTYIIHRLMSETFSLILGDMLFVDTIKESGFSYDYTKRKIYPLFAALKQHYNIDTNVFDDRIKTLFYAVSKYFILGDDSLINFDDTVNEFKAFQAKYDNFAIADMEWTDSNYTQMISNLGCIKQWISETSLPEHLHTLSKFMDDMPNFDNIFDYVFDDYYAKFLSLIVEGSHDNNFFIKYMIGQSLIFTKFSFVPETKIFKDNIFKELEQEIDLDAIYRIRNYYKLYVIMLKNKHLIQEEECDIFKQMYPLFNPVYVNYDIAQNHDLTTTISNIIGQL